MTGSGRNVGLYGIVIGMALAENEAGHVFPADAVNPAFAVATDGAPVKGYVGYSTDGVVTRQDWTMIAGSRYLTPGQAYFVAAGGKLATSGQQQVGTARSRTDLRVAIGPVQAAFTQIHTVVGRPPNSLGNPNDLAYDYNTGRIFGPKGQSVWPLTGAYLMKPVGLPGQSPFQAVASSTGWTLCS